MDYYGVRLLHQITVSGKPDEGTRDEFFSERTKCYEESVIIVKADSGEDAFTRAEAKAKKNDESYMNKYGQTVKHAFYDSVECFKLLEDPQNGTEVFSACFACDDGDLERVMDEKYGSLSAEEMHNLRHT